MKEATNPYESPKSEFAAAGQSWMCEQADQLRKVYIGLSLAYWGIVVTLLGVVVGVAGGFATMGAGTVVAMTVLVVGGVLILVGSILSFVGPFYCLAVPVESGAKGFIIAAVILQLSNFVISPVLAFVDLPALSEFTAALAGPLVTVVGVLAFVLFMRRLAAFIGEVDLQARAFRVLIGAGLVFLGWMAMLAIIISSGEQPPRNQGMTAFLGCGVMLAGMIVFVMYANLINDLRRFLRQREQAEPAEKPTAQDPSS